MEQLRRDERNGRQGGIDQGCPRSGCAVETGEIKHGRLAVIVHDQIPKAQEASDKRLRIRGDNAQRRGQRRDEDDSDEQRRESGESL